MRYVKSNEKTTLVLNSAWLPTGFFTANNAMRVLLVGGGKALDKNCMMHDWASWTGDLRYDEGFEDQAYIKGPSKDWRVPHTLVVQAPYRKGQFKKQRNPNRRQLYEMYDGICQYCHKKIDFKFATREHVIPRSIGGSNDDFNLVLACLKCNSDKSDQYPYFDKNNKPVQIKTLASMHLRLLTLGVKVRPEWSQFLFK